ncbi:hypothetical protein KAI87_13000 [Myxococcota bacterium]|nr:hypothetical protein [Myxococcota bacterium]
MKKFRLFTLALQTSALLSSMFSISACMVDDELTARHAKLIVSPFIEGQPYTADEESLTIDLGDVPIHAEKSSIFLLVNDTSMLALIYEINVITSTGQWDEPTFAEPAPQTDEPPLAADSPWMINPFETRKLVLGFAPTEEGAADITYELVTNAENLLEGKIQVHIIGHGTL